MTANGTVLVVEDNEALREMFRRRLSRRGYGVRLATNGEDGISQAAEFAPDIILLDMSLPGKDGWVVASELKSVDITKEIPLIAVTAHAMRGDRERALQAGCDEYITKPIHFKTLFKVMDHLIQR